MSMNIHSTMAALDSVSDPDYDAESEFEFEAKSESESEYEFQLKLRIQNVQSSLEYFDGFLLLPVSPHLCRFVWSSCSAIGSLQSCGNRKKPKRSTSRLTGLWQAQSQPAARLVADMSTRRCCHLTQCRLLRRSCYSLDRSPSLSLSVSQSPSLSVSLNQLVNSFDCNFTCIYFRGILILIIILIIMMIIVIAQLLHFFLLPL